LYDDTQQNFHPIRLYLLNRGTRNGEPVPLYKRVAADLWLWKETSKYRLTDDWIFASSHTDGRHPSWPDAVLQKVIRPAALRAGIPKVIGWHTFRHTYSTLLIANGENVNVVQELMRHANSRCTLEIYTRARTEQKRKAQQRLAEAIFSDEADIQAPIIHGISQDNSSHLERSSRRMTQLRGLNQ
jgi:integrase